MKFQGALLKEQGVTFAIVIVKQHIFNNHSEANRLIANFQQTILGGVPVILMAQNMQGIPTYYGRRDIANFMSRVSLQAVPWKEYTIG